MLWLSAEFDWQHRSKILEQQIRNVDKEIPVVIRLVTTAVLNTRIEKLDKKIP